MTDEETLSEYLKTIRLQRPRHFDGTFVMGSYVPQRRRARALPGL